jgi:hypothetical protein
MSYERQHSQRTSPPPAYVEDTPGGMENEVYIDGTLYVDGVPVSRSEQQHRAGRRNARADNPCEKVFRLIRSKCLIESFSVMIFFFF